MFYFNSPENNVIIEITSSPYTSHSPLWSKAGFHKRPLVEHPQQRMDQYLQRNEIITSSYPPTKQKLNQSSWSSSPWQPQITHFSTMWLNQSNIKWTGFCWCDSAQASKIIWTNLKVYLYLFASWCARMIAVVGKVASEDVQFTGNDPPSVTQGRFTTGWQEGLELTGIKHGWRNSWTFPRSQPTKRAVWNLMRKTLLSIYLMSTFWVCTL